MNRRIPAVALLAIVLWASTVLAAVVRAQQDQTTPTSSAAGQTLTNDGLRTMLENMGYEPSKLSNGYLISVKKEGWTYNVQFVLSKDESKLGMNANLGVIEKLEDVTAAQWLALLAANSDVDPSMFFLQKDQKKLYLHRALDNRSVTPAYIRKQVDNFCADIHSTADLWKFTK